MTDRTLTRASVGDLLPQLRLSDALTRRPGGTVGLLEMVRAAAACTVAWLVATALSPTGFDIFAPVTTLLVIQASPFSTIGVSVQRVLGTSLGVLLASFWVNLVGVSWWSFALGVLGGLALAQLLPMAVAGRLTVPVGVVFVMGMGSGSLQTDLSRVVDVLIGGVLGIAAVYLFPRRPPVGQVDAALGAYATGLADVLDSMAAELRAPRQLDPGVLHDFVADSRRLADRAATTRSALAAATEAAHLNPRAGAVRPALVADARRFRWLTALAISVRGLAAAVDRGYDHPGLPPALPADALADLLQRTGGLVRLVWADGPSAGQRVADELGADIVAEVRATAEARPDVADVLPYLSILGRIDLVRAQLAGGPAYDVDGDVDEDTASHAPAAAG